MSCYILNTLDGEPVRFFKTDYLMSDCGARKIEEPESFVPPAGKIYVLVIENVSFDAALVILSKFDFDRAKYERMGRDATWLEMDRAVVRDMAPPMYKNDPALR